jgi:tetratricopeptide (TPR) repeat protein
MQVSLRHGRGRSRRAAALAGILLLTQARAHAQDPLAAAREMYANASYDEALHALDAAKARGTLPPESMTAVEQYRSFCLLALGRPAEAEVALAAAIRMDPWYQLNDGETPPRIRAIFREARRRLLPEIAMQEYREAKARYDEKNHAEAFARFRRLMALIDDPDMQGRLADLRMLASGFLDLSSAALTSAATPAPAPAAAEAAPAPAAATAPEPPDPDRVFTVADRNVTPPVAVRQPVPALPSSLKSLSRSRGLIELLIDERGQVRNVALRQSIHPAFDPKVLSAATSWRYRPASHDGTPVKYRKLVEINVR